VIVELTAPALLAGHSQWLLQMAAGAHGRQWLQPLRRLCWNGLVGLLRLHQHPCHPGSCAVPPAVLPPLPPLPATAASSRQRWLTGPLTLTLPGAWPPCASMVCTCKPKSMGLCARMSSVNLALQACVWRWQAYDSSLLPKPAPSLFVYLLTSFPRSKGVRTWTACVLAPTAYRLAHTIESILTYSVTQSYLVPPPGTCCTLKCLRTCILTKNIQSICKTNDTQQRTCTCTRTHSIQ